MSIANIIKDFYAGSNFSKDDEVDLFRKLAKAIANNSSSVFIDETHGASKCNVTFDLTSGPSTRCEIADLLIVTTSKHSPYLRATFWQAKKENNPKWASISTLDSHIDFRGQFNQWDLLSRRPSIAGVPPFNPPSDILESFGSGSIGSFGVFYKKHSNIEIMHSIAEFVSCGNPKAKHPTMVANGNLEKYSYFGNEVIVRSTLQGFLEALFNHQIGSPIFTAELPHQWLVNYAASKVKSTPSIDLDLFSGDLGPVNGEINTSSGDGLSLLLVDTEEMT